jgi:uncharacterized protein (TIGR02145 family)/prepilin-type N-terminal cleavage/methylation domain-containing protein
MLFKKDVNLSLSLSLKKVRSFISSRAAFTLIELLVVIGILAVLATTTLLVLNPAQMFKQARDGTRLSDLSTINSAILVYQSSGGSALSLGTSGIIYVSLPSDNSDCSGLGLPTPPTGYAYACKPSSSYRNTDGTGWIPINFQSVSFGSPLGSTLPIDPTNTVANGFYYTYMAGSWALSATMESDKYLASATSDGGYSYARAEVGSDLSLNQHIPNCGGQPITDIDGNSYSTIQIGKQCWMAENIMTTKYPDGSAITRGPTGATWAGTDLGYYAYPPNTANTAEETLENIIANDLGFVYQWSAAMHGSITAGAQGICPTGWHIPTDTEWKTLVESQATAGCESSTGWQCSPAGSHLSNYTLNHDNSSGFSGILAGSRLTTGGFYARLSYAFVWSSVESGGNAWIRDLSSDYATVDRTTGNKAYGFSVRCLKD